MINENLTTQTLSETTAIRLFNSVAVTDARTSPLIAVTSDKSVVSIHSADEAGNSCRICRWNRSDMEITRCPCNCKGTVGFIHMACLKRWIMHRKDNHCEICHGSFIIPQESVNFWRMLRSFCVECAGPIVKHSLFAVSLLPLGHVVLHQALVCMENINKVSPQQQVAVSEIMLASFTLLTSSTLFFHYFEFVTTRLLTIRYILRHWWSFGNSNDFSIIEVDSEMLDFFN